jgi:hypothetical protein
MLDFVLWIVVAISGSSVIVLTAKLALDEHLLHRQQRAVLPAEDATATGPALTGPEPLTI